MRICLIYDCLFPHTVGGAERWYRGLAERLAADGHDVTYLTLRQWDRGADPDVPGVHVCAVGPRMPAARLPSQGLRGEATMPGAYDGPLDAPQVREAEPFVVFAGRHIPEKRVPAIVPALDHARGQIPALRATILGDGPDRPEVL